MRQRKTIKIDDREITVKELTVADILEFENFLSIDDDSIDGFLGMIKGVLPKLTDGVILEDLKTMAPSEIEKLIEALKEVNAPFLRGIAWVGLGDLMATLRKTITRDCLNLLSASLGQGTQESGNTDSQPL